MSRAHPTAAAMWRRPEAHRPERGRRRALARDVARAGPFAVRPKAGQLYSSATSSAKSAMITLRRIFSDGVR